MAHIRQKAIALFLFNCRYSLDTGVSQVTTAKEPHYDHILCRRTLINHSGEPAHQILKKNSHINSTFSVKDFKQREKCVRKQKPL